MDTWTRQKGELISLMKRDLHKQITDQHKTPLQFFYVFDRVMDMYQGECQEHMRGKAVMTYC